MSQRMCSAPWMANVFCSMMITRFFSNFETAQPSVQLIREQVAVTMLAEEIHQDVHDFINKLVTLTGPDGAAQE